MKRVGKTVKKYFDIAEKEIREAYGISSQSPSPGQDYLEKEIGFSLETIFDVVDDASVIKGVIAADRYSIDLTEITLSEIGIASDVLNGVPPTDGMLTRGDPKRVLYAKVVNAITEERPDISLEGVLSPARTRLSRLNGNYFPSTDSDRKGKTNRDGLIEVEDVTAAVSRLDGASFGNKAGNTLGIGSSGFGAEASARADHDGNGASNRTTSGTRTNGYGNTLGIGFAGFGSQASGAADKDANGVADQNRSGGPDHGGVSRTSNNRSGNSAPSSASDRQGFSGRDGGSSRGSSAGGGYTGAHGFPVVIDMDGDGIELTTLNQSTSTFDFDNDGYREPTAWTTGDDALLVFDIDNDDQVTQAKEIAFAQWTEAEDTDLEALASEFDSNHDGVLDKQDSGWNSFKIWQDSDRDGITDAGEMKTLEEAGIRSVGLKSRNNTATTLADGTTVFSLADVQRENGEMIDAADVAFAYNALGFKTSTDENGNRIYRFEDGEIRKVKTLSQAEKVFNLGGATSHWIAAEGNGLNNTLDATAKTDNVLLYGAAGDDILLGGAGDDYLIGGDGKDSLQGGAGNDFLFADGADLSTHEGVHGGEGYDQLFITDNSALSLNADDLGVEAIHAGSAADNIHGSDDTVNYVFNAAGGNDVLNGAGGNDLLLGGNGDDTLNGNKGNDTLLGQQGTDSLTGNDGDDVLAGGRGNDTLNGGAGNDTYYYDRGDGADLIHDYAQGTYLEKYDYQETVEYQEKYSYHQRVKRKSGKRSRWVNELRTGYRTATRDENRTGYREVHGEVDGGIDTLQFGTGIALTDIVLTRSGQDMTVELRDKHDANIISDDRITIQDWADRKNRIETFAFADGNRLDFSQIMQGQYGMAANDTLTGTAQGDFLSGGNGNDALNGQDGRDILTGGNGNDLLNGGAAKDILFGDSGHDTINGEQGNDYLIGASGNDTLNGNDGDDVLAGMEGTDTLQGNEGSDLLLGGEGNDILHGGAGDDTYIYFRGDGRDEIYDYKLFEETYQERYVSGRRRERSFGKSGRWVNEYRTRTKTRTVQQDAGNDTLQFGYSIALTDLFFETRGENLLIGIRDMENPNRLLDELDDQLSIKRWSHTENRIETFEFANGLTLDMSEVTAARSGYAAEDELTGSAGSDILSGGDGNDTLTGLEANDYLIGGQGDDQLNGGQGDDDLFGNEGNDILSGEQGDDYLLGGAGSDTLLGGNGNDVITGGAGNDILKGGRGNDTYIFNRGDGKDTIDETAYEDIQQAYRYTERVKRPDRSWKGRLTGQKVWVNETRTGYKTVTRAVTGGDDTLQFGASIDVSDLIISMVNTDLLIELKPLANDNEITDQVTVKNWSTPEFRVEHLRFINDFAVDLGEINYANSGTANSDILTADGQASWLGGQSGDDLLTGSASADILFGGEGSDTISGGLGDDIYIYNRGDGHDILTDTGSSTVGKNTNSPGGDKLLFGTDISIEDLVLQREGNDLLIYIRSIQQAETPLTDLTDSIRIAGWAAKESRIEVLQFFDGKDFDISQITHTYLGQDLLNGLSNVTDDVLTGSASSDWLDGFSGNDKLRAAAGDDFLFGRAGHDELFGESGKDILSGGEGNDILSGGDNDDLIAGDQGNDRLTGDTGNDILLGGAGDDVITGGSGDDYIIGDLGNDTYIAGSGYDIYKFGYGDGQDTYEGNNEKSASGSDVFLLEDDVKKEAIWFERVDNNLVMRLLGSKDSITFSAWYNSNETNNHIMGFQSGDELLRFGDINQLVSAMAAFEPNDGSTAYGIRTSELPESIQLAVNTAWKAA